MYERQPEEEHGVPQQRPGDLKLLSDLKDWTIPPDKPDIRGWKLVGMDGKDYGKIDDLLVDPHSGEAIFGVVSHGEILGLGGKRTLITLDTIRVDRDNKFVRFIGSPDLLKQAPEYSKDTHEFDQFYDYWSSKAETTRESDVGQKWASPEDRGRELSGKLEEQYLKHHPEEARTGATEESRAAGVEEGKIGRIPIIRKGEEAIEGVQPGQTVVHEGEAVEIPNAGERIVITSKVVIEAKTEEEESEEDEDQSGRV